MTALQTRPPATLAPALAARVFTAIRAEHSANTLRAYESAWKAWSAWAGAHRVDALPAAPVFVAAYLSARAERYSMPTVRMAAAAIAAAHRAANHENPLAHPAVRAVLKGLGRLAAAAGRSTARQAEALTDDALAAIRASACRPRHRETAARARARGRVDIALCQVMADAGLRRSEAAALRWADVQRERDGSGRLRILHSKTDTEGRGAVVAITKRAMRDLKAIRGDAAGDARVFGLGVSAIHRRIRAAARAAGLGETYGGHSGRVGLARRMTRRQAPITTIMQQGRWRSSDMVARYTRGESAGAALKYCVRSEGVKEERDARQS